MPIKTVAVMLVALGTLVLLGVGGWPLVGDVGQTGSVIPAGIEVPLAMGELRAYHLAYLIDAQAEGVAPLMAPTFLRETMGVEVLHSNEALQRFRQQAPLDGLLIHASALNWLDSTWLPQAYREGLVIVGLDLWFDELAKLVDDPCIIERRPSHERALQGVPFFTNVNLQLQGEADDIARLEEGGFCTSVPGIKAPLHVGGGASTDALIDSKGLLFFARSLEGKLQAASSPTLDPSEQDSPSPAQSQRLDPSEGESQRESYTCNVPCRIGQNCEVKAQGNAQGYTYHMYQNYKAKTMATSGTFYYMTMLRRTSSPMLRSSCALSAKRIADALIPRGGTSCFTSTINQSRPSAATSNGCCPNTVMPPPKWALSLRWFSFFWPPASMASLSFR